MWRNFSGLSTSLLHCSKSFAQTKRGVFILKRKHEPRLNKLGSFLPKRLKKKHYYYELLEDTNVQKAKKMEVVLTEDVPGMGFKGEKIELNMYSAYKHLLLPKLGLYADTPEARSIVVTKEEQLFSSLHSKAVENFLATQPLTITLSAETEWKLEPWHVKLALRKVGVITKDECITIPKKITGPNLEIENKDFLVELTMNKTEKFLLRCRIYHWSSANPLLNKKVMDINSQSEPLFPDEKEKIDKIIHFELEVKKKKMMNYK